MKSLAEHLGAVDPRPESDRIVPSGFDALADVTDPIAFCRGIVNSREWRQYIMSCVVLGDIPSWLGQTIVGHAWGKPAERVEIKDTTERAEDLSAEQLESRASRLMEMARFLRRAEQFDNDDFTQESVH